MSYLTSNTDNTPHTPPHYLMWFRRDLRLHDNTALVNLCKHANINNSANANTNAKHHAYTNQAKQEIQLTALFFITPKQWAEHDMALTQVDLILRTLPKLARLLANQLNINLVVQVVDDFNACVDKLSDFCLSNAVTHVFANHEYELNETLRDQQISKVLQTDGIKFSLYHDQCILPPQSIVTQDGQMYQIFTPFYKKWLAQLDILSEQGLQTPHPKLDFSGNANDNTNTQKALKNIAQISYQVLANYQTNWLDKITKCDVNHSSNNNLLRQTLNQTATSLTNARNQFPAGEVNACHRLFGFVDADINRYPISRDTPSHQATSQLSPYLAIGSLSPRLCYQQALKAVHNPNANALSSDSSLKWISELAWRDFYRHVLVDKPNLSKHQACHIDTDHKVNWSYHKDDFVKWCRGETGFPLVDAAMRCLNTTGFMHNRLRMVVAMFLSKDLLIDWRWGERYFMQMLIDGDFASNNGGWQWSASTGTDAAPYFRIMNPFSQSKTHDKDAIFIKTWLPELVDVPANVLHDEAKLRKYLADNPTVDYPMPMVEHKQARIRTIERFKSN